MFGTLKPVYNQLNTQDEKLYKMYYCGLCSALGRVSTFLRMTLSYDITFVYMLLDLENISNKRKCFCPGKVVIKRDCIDNQPLADYLAAASVALVKGKCLDNIVDREKRIQSKLMLCLLKSDVKKTYRKYEKIFKITDISLQKISSYEKSNKKEHVSVIADEFGKLTGEIFADAPLIIDRKLHYKLGYWIGRWIYVADAALDIKEDYKKGRFNPFIDDYKTKLDIIVNKNEKEIYEELFKAHDCVTDVVKLISAFEEGNDMVKMISNAMDAAEGNIFNIQEEIKNER